MDCQTAVRDHICQFPIRLIRGNFTFQVRYLTFSSFLEVLDTCIFLNILKIMFAMPNKTVTWSMHIRLVSDIKKF